MPIDPEVAIGAHLPDRTFSWESSDVLLCHLAIGAGSRPGDNLDPAALRRRMMTSSGFSSFIAGYRRASFRRAVHTEICVSITV